MFSQETFIMQTFSLTFWEIIHFLKMLYCPGHPVLSVLSRMPCQANFRLTCLRCTVPFFLSQLSCQGCPAVVVTSWLPCLASLFLLSCSGPPVLSFLSQLYYPACPLWLLYPRCLFFMTAVLSLLSCSDCPTLSVLSV
jgi:hypothetical protein